MVQTMKDEELQQWVERVSLESFGRPFKHMATFNGRLKATGGRYFMKSHHIEISPYQLSTFGVEETEKIIKHELCHYHLHLLKRGYRHRDEDFKRLLAQVGGSRYCQSLPERRVEPFRYKLVCKDCGMEYPRKRRINPAKYACGKCRGKLFLKTLDLNSDT
ncbi:SprT family protein [Paenibacillus sp. KS-LC4]|uniref:SprT family protein n=1 Tax=Paenibacillus sp. KS-LC4 TaxID=2979727 RepID=UPI0030D1EE47